MNKKIKTLIALLIILILLAGAWWVWRNQLSSEVSEKEAILIVKDNCEQKNPDYVYNYNAIGRTNNEWRIPILNLNCPCYATVNIETGEFTCMILIHF